MIRQARKPRVILISGIGIAGPTLAYWLAARDFKPTLVERAPCLRTSGYVIDFWGVGYDVADRMGLLPDLRRDGYDVQEVRFVDACGRRVGGFSVDVFRRLTNGRYVSLARGDLAQLIYRKIDGCCQTIFDDSVTRIEQEGDSVCVEFERAPPRHFDLVIGADGLHSQIRRLVFASNEDRFENYLGFMVAAFEVAGYRPRDEAVYVSYALPGKQVARFAMREDRTLFLFVWACDEPPTFNQHDTNTPREILRTTFGDAGWECRRILASLDELDGIYFDRVSQIRMDAWSKGRVALVGDAAFCPSLLAGQGSALAMAAAYVLAGELTKTRSDPEEAFRRYESLLRPLISSKQMAAERFAGAFAPRTRFGLFLRNQITKAFAIPLVAKLAMGPSLMDRIDLPDYPLRKN